MAYTASGIPRLRWGVAILLPLLGCCARTAPVDYSGPTAGWASWGGDEGGMRYTPATQITPANVGQLKVAWTYRIGEPSLLPEHPTNPADIPGLLAKGITPELKRMPALEATPILAEGRLYLCSSTNRVVALDPETGRELWSFDPKLDATGGVLVLCRGVSYYHDAQAQPGSACASRIFTGTQDARLIALDAKDGKPCADFGSAGTVDLKERLGPMRPGDYGVTVPPAISGDRVIVGGRITEDMRTDMPAGVVRAFDARSGALLWAWNSVPPQAEGVSADGTYRRSTANTWSVFSVDTQRNLIFIPTGNAQVGLYGTTRDTDGRDYYAASVVALDAATGKVVWHFQTVHHDIWDYDVPAQPVLFDFPTPNGPVAALAQPTKQGYLFILNRATGEPLVPVEERAAPQQWAVEGEHLAPTQPVPTNETYVLQRPKLTEADMWGFTPWDKGKCRDLFRSKNYEGAIQRAFAEGHHHVSGQPRGDELGQCRDRPGAQPAHHQHEPRGDGCAAGAARAGGCALCQGRVAARAGGDALCGAVDRDAVAVGCAVQQAAVGRTRGDRSQERQARVAGAPGHDARPCPLPAMAEDRHAQHRRAARDRLGTDLHRGCDG